MSSEKRKSGQRIVSLAPSATSILVAIGCRNQLVGVTRWCHDVAPVGRLPRLGDCWRLNMEEVLVLEPTLLIGSVPYKPEAVRAILESPVSFLAMNPRTLEDIYNDIRLLGGMCGQPARAQKLVTQMQSALARIQQRVVQRAARAARVPRVYCEAWPNPRISSPPWVAELVEIAGGKMVMPSGQRVSDEGIAEAMPDVIVLAWAATGTKADPDTVYRNPYWADLPAVRERRVYVIRDEWLNTPGPPLLRGVQELVRALHGPSPRHTPNAAKRRPR